jgi:hypothetical protein
MKFSAILSTLIITASMGYAAPAAVLATVNGQPITTNDANTFMSKAAPGMTYDKLDPKMKRQVVDQLVNQKLLKGQVATSGIQNTPQFKLAYAALKDDLAVDMWMKNQMSKITVSDSDTKAFYDANKEKMKGQDGKVVAYEKAKGEITQFVKMEKFKASMMKTTEALRAKSKVEVKL